MTNLLKTKLRALVELTHELEDNIHGYCPMCFDFFRKGDYQGAEIKRLKETIKDLRRYRTLLETINIPDDSDASDDFSYESHKLMQIESEFGTVPQISWTINQYRRELDFWNKINDSCARDSNSL